jgi:excinuclease UvrABC helicase subunit UvrB
VILLFEEGELKPRCSRARRPGPEELVVSRAVVGQVVKEKVAAKKLEFERAAELRNRIRSLKLKALELAQ